jgi:hypothetical protein
MTTIIRTLALPIVSAGILAGAALGLAGTAAAQAQAPNGPGYSYAPQTHAAPAATQAPGWQAHHGPERAAILERR